MCENYFTKKEVLAILKISKTSLETLLREKQLKSFNVNSRIRISEYHIDEYLEANIARDNTPQKNQMAAN